MDIVSASKPATQTDSHPASWPEIRSASQLFSQPARPPARQPLSRRASQAASQALLHVPPCCIPPLYFSSSKSKISKLSQLA